LLNLLKVKTSFNVFLWVLGIINPIYLVNKKVIGSLIYCTIYVCISLARCIYYGQLLRLSSERVLKATLILNCFINWHTYAKSTTRRRCFRLSISPPLSPPSSLAASSVRKTVSLLRPASCEKPKAELRLCVALFASVCVCVALHNFHANAQAALKRSATKVHSPRALHSPRLFLFLPRPLSLSRLALC